MTTTAAPLTARVDAAINSNPHLIGRQFTHHSNSGVVVLSGTVDSYFQKQMAQEAVRHLDGVQQIDNQLEVHWS